MTYDDPLIEVTLPAPVEEVWAHLRDPALIRRWFGWEYEGLEGEIEFIFGGPPAEALAQMPPDAGFDVDAATHTIEWRYGGDQVDRFEVRADGGDHAVLRVTRTIPADAWDGVYDDLAEGWISFVQQLRFALERHPGEDRRTVFLMAPVTEAGADAALASITAEGEPWFRTDHQAGVVDADGHLRLVCRSRDTALLTITTHGLGAEVAALRDTWSRWWAEHVGEMPEDGDFHD